MRVIILTRNTAFIFLTFIFSGALVIASVLAGKIAIFGPFVFPVGVLAFSITFLMTDTVSEFWVKEKANRMVLGGFLSLVVFYGLIQLSLIWPSAPFWNKEQEFAAIFAVDNTNHHRQHDSLSDQSVPRCVAISSLKKTV